MALRSWKGEVHTCAHSHVGHMQACVPGVCAQVYHSQKRKVCVHVCVLYVCVCTHMCV